MCFKNESSCCEPAAAPKSPWRRILRESLKPKMTRRVVNKARVNLSKYWSKFEELAAANVPLMSFEPVARKCDNEMNDNKINERLDLLL